MLISCPECNKQISDKAISCPNCGLPMSASVIVKPKSVSKREHRRLKNGFGQIRHLSGERRCPYVAYPSITKDMLDDNGKPTGIKPLGYFETWYDAYDFLSEYNKGTHNGITVGALYEEWLDQKFNSVGKQYSEATLNVYKSAKNVLLEIWDVPFASLRANDLQELIDKRIDMSMSSLNIIKNTFKQMYKYALSQGIVEKDYSEYMTTKPNDATKGEPLTLNDIDKLWAHQGNEYVDIALILLYSGLRITELKKTTIDLDRMVFEGGIKTTAGKDRVIPIHPLIQDIVIRFDQENYNPRMYTHFNFVKLKNLTGIDCSANGKTHTPHDLRHTFSWLADKYGMDSVSKHLIMGHSLGTDVEQHTYGHRTLDQLREEMNKIKR